MNWLDYINTNIQLNINNVIEKEIFDISQFPTNAYGFVYLIVYTDGTSYIGKKNLFSYKKVYKLKNGNWPKGTIEVTESKKNTGKGSRITVYIGKFESNWKVYQGSHEECKTKTVSKKFILAVAKNSLELTYLEAKYLFAASVLENDHFLNDNILGRFYKAHLINPE